MLLWMGGFLRMPPVHLSEQTVSTLDRRLEHGLSAVLERADNRLNQTARLLAANSYQRVLDRGFALVTDQGGKPVKTSKDCLNLYQTLVSNLVR